jgi:class 3 adenylate cyclase
MDCGTQLVVAERREERKVVSVLFADLVGFTSRSELLDVEEVRGTLAPYHQALRAILERFGGTVEKFIGDAVVAVFGAPTTHEDDPERAVRAALAVRDAIADVGEGLHVRIGVNTGEALVAIGAQPLAGEGMVSGDVVNTAARLQAAAPTDGVLVGEVTYRATERQIVFEAHDPVDAKGKRDPVRCWVALEPRSRQPSPLRDAVPLVGRRGEVDSLVGALRRVRQSSSAQLVTLVGVPGIGKTRLVAELARFADEEPELTTWREGRVLAYGEGIAFSALAQIVKQQAGILESDDAVTAGQKLDSAIAAAGLAGVDAVWVRNQIAPLVGATASLDGGGLREAFAGWRMFLEAVAAEGPAVVVFDDLHWADDALLDFIDELIDRAGAVPLLVVCTARPELLERRPGWGGGKTNALTIGLQPLSQEETARLVESLIDRTLLDPDAERLLLERADGNPLYAQEYVRMLVERGASTTVLPETVQGIIAARLDGLSADEKAVLQDAAVLGRVAWLGAVCAVGNRDRIGTDELVFRLDRKQLIRRERRSSVAGETEFVFAHALIRDVAYGQLTRAQRAERHERAADWIEQLAGDRDDKAELVAHHVTTALELRVALGNATAPLRARAAQALLAGTRQAAARHDHESTVRHADAALALDPDASTRAELLVRRAIAQHTAGAMDEAELLAAHRAAVAADRIEDAVQTAYLLSEWAEYSAGDGAAIDRYTEEARRLAATLPAGPITILPAYSTAYRLYVQGRHAETIALADTEIGRARSAGAEAAAALMLVWRGMARVDLGDAGGAADAREAYTTLSEHAHPKAAVTAHNFAELLVAFGQLEEAQAVYTEGRGWARRTGDAQAERWCIVGLARLAYYAGRPEDAGALLDEATGESRRIEQVDVVRGRLVLEHDPRRACEIGAAGLAYADQTQNTEWRLVALALCARAAHAAGDPVAAGQALDAWILCWHEIGGATFAPALVEAGLVLAAHERHAELAAAAQLTIQSAWRGAARALANRRYEDAAAILDRLPCVPMRDAASALARQTPTVLS